MQDLRVGLIQMNLEWENPEINLRRIEERMSEEVEFDLIVLPEMFSTGFSMRCRELANAEHEENCLRAMLRWSRMRDAAITGSIMSKDGNTYRNRLFWVEPNGRICHYDKRHLFSIGKESEFYTKGKERLIIEFRGWKIMPLICYDLRFPVWCRNGLSDGKPLFDLQLFLANWPALRSGAWKKLLPARAIENQCYVAGLNRVGNDVHGYAHSGDSAVYNFIGETIAEAPEFSENFIPSTLSLDALNKYRQQFPVLEDMDGFNILPEAPISRQ